MSQDRSVKPADFGTHHCLNSSGLVHASNTMRAGPLIVRVMTSSRADFRSDVVRFFMAVGSLPVLFSIAVLLAFQLVDHLLQFIEARVPEPAVALDPRRLILQPPGAEPAGPHAADLLGRHETRLLQHAHVLFHPRQGHMEPLGESRNRGVFASELLQHAPAGRVRKRGERGIEGGRPILNHMVQYTGRVDRVQGVSGVFDPVGLSRSAVCILPSAGTRGDGPRAVDDYLRDRTARRFAPTLLRGLTTTFLVSAAANRSRNPSASCSTALPKAPSCPTWTIATDRCSSNDGGRNTFTASIE